LKMLNKEHGSGKRQLKDFKTGEFTLVLRTYSFRYPHCSARRDKTVDCPTINYSLKENKFADFGSWF